MSEESQQGYCRQCGAQIRSNTLFCVHCGARLGDPGSSTSLERQEITNFEFGGQQAGTAFTNPWQWFKEQPQARKILVILAAMVPLVLLSPLTFILGIVLIAVCICWIVISAINRRPWQGWAIIAVFGVIPTLMFGSLSDAIYDTGFVSGGDSSSSEEAEPIAQSDQSNNSGIEIDTEEQEYFNEVDAMESDMRTMVDRQVELYNFCLEVCAPQSWTEQNQNVEDGAELLEDAYSVTPPSDLEDSHSAFIEGMETSYDILERIPYGMVGGTEIDSLIDDAKEDFSRSVDLID